MASHTRLMPGRSEPDHGARAPLDAADRRRPRFAAHALVVQALVTAPGLALLVAAALAGPTWLERYFVPGLFQLREEQLRTLTIVRICASAAGLILVGPLGVWAGRWAARRSAAAAALGLLPSLLAALLAIGVSELLLEHLPWLAAHQLPAQREPLRRADPYVGWVYAGGRTGRGVWGGRTIEYVLDRDSHRIRAPGEAVDYARPSIVFAGESIMAGHGVTYDESIPARVAARFGLQAADQAVGGYATDQAYLRFVREWPRYRRARAVVVLFMPLLFHRNLDHDRPYLTPGLAWRPPADELRLVQIARRLVPYRSQAEQDEAYAMTRHALAAMVEMARTRGAVPLILVPQLTRETAEEARIRDRVLAGLPYLQVEVDPAWRIPHNRHPDARADAAIATAAADYLQAHGLAAEPATVVR